MAICVDQLVTAAAAGVLTQKLNRAGQALTGVVFISAQMCIAQTETVINFSSLHTT